MKNNPYLDPQACADQFGLYAAANKELGNAERERCYRSAATFLREFCQPIDAPERTVMLLMYRALKIAVKSSAWDYAASVEKDEIRHAIQVFEDYNRVSA